MCVLFHLLHAIFYLPLSNVKTFYGSIGDEGNKIPSNKNTLNKIQNISESRPFERNEKLNETKRRKKSKENKKRKW